MSKQKKKPLKSAKNNAGSQTTKEDSKINLFWKKKTYINGIGTVEGLVSEIHKKAFQAIAPKGSFDARVTPIDPQIAKTKLLKQRMRRRAGFKD